MYIEQRIEELEKQVGTRSDKEKQELIAFANGKANDPFAVTRKVRWLGNIQVTSEHVGRSRKCAA